MKKTLMMIAAAAVACTALFAAPKKNAAPEVPPITEPVELKYGTDWTLETTWFGEDYFTISGPSVHYNEGAKNNNHAVLFKLARRNMIPNNTVIEIEYTIDDCDPAKACQIALQPATTEGTGSADYNNQNYPILYNNFEPDNPTVFTIDCNKALKSSVRKVFDGWRFANNQGSWDRYTWQGDWGFTITKVTLKPAK